MATGSYVEDGHNFVGTGLSPSTGHQEASEPSSNPEPRIKISTLMLSKRRTGQECAIVWNMSK